MRDNRDKETPEQIAREEELCWEAYFAEKERKEQQKKKEIEGWTTSNNEEEGGVKEDHVDECFGMIKDTSRMKRRKKKHVCRRKLMHKAEIAQKSYLKRVEHDQQKHCYYTSKSAIRKAKRLMRRTMKEKGIEFA